MAEPCIIAPPLLPFKKLKSLVDFHCLVDSNSNFYRVLSHSYSSSLLSHLHCGTHNHILSSPVAFISSHSPYSLPQRCTLFHLFRTSFLKPELGNSFVSPKDSFLFLCFCFGDSHGNPQGLSLAVVIRNYSCQIQGDCTSCQGSAPGWYVQGTCVHAMLSLSC